VRRRILQLLCCATTIVAARDAGAQVATQVVQFEVRAVSQIGISGTPSALVINSATAGGQPTSVASTGSSYAITTNEVNQKIIASIDQAMPGGVTLEVALTAPTGAMSAGNVILGTAGTEVVTGISGLRESALPISYRLSATAAAQLGSSTRTVTFTIVAGS
jgi:hypothetical protein